ncbi:MAG: hypothetical protein KDK04_23415 [Candidatus Competibacteraceae bacterium]|nr:hypothetical protein [Candidatus Competibacteraceae bacterium]MCB1814644.1 hypothetical protein [Candidatus Competibacteraceae bacterium]
MLKKEIILILAPVILLLVLAVSLVINTLLGQQTETDQLISERIRDKND